MLIFLVVLTVGVVTIKEVAKNAEALDLESISSSESFVLVNSQSLAQSSLDSFSATGKNQTWLDFDGVNDEVDLGFSNGIDRSKNFSLTLWFNASDNDGSRIIDYSPNNFNLYIMPSGILNATYKNSSGNLFELKSVSNVNDSIWHFVAFSYNQDNKNLSLYLDGSFLGSAIVGMGDSGDITFDLSSTFGGAQSFKGYLDEFRIYKNYVPTDLEIASIYNSKRIPNSSLVSTGLKNWYSFNANNGSILYDYSGVNNGTISGATWKNDGVNVTLTEGVDYTVDLSAGTVTSVGANDYSWFESAYVYVVDNNTAASVITHLIEVMIAVGFLALIFFYIKSRGVF